MRTTFFLTPRQLEWRSTQWSRPSISIGLAFLLAVLAILGSRQSSSSITSISPSQPVLGAEAAVQPITSAVSRPEADKVPPGLTASDWSGIKGEYERHRHAAFPVEGGHQARNYAQQWLTRFDGRGFEIKPEGAGWRWGLELQSYGFAGCERRLPGKAQVRTETERVTYAWNDELDEWFVNDRRGLEHGFTVKQRPEHREGDTSPLELRLTVRGGLKARVGANGGAVSFTAANGSTAVNYSGLKVWDADGKVMPARFSVEGGALSLSVEESAARYPLTIDPIVQQAYLKASNTGDFDVFGSSVAISGVTAVIGAQNEDSNATGVNGDQSDNSASNSGAAYVFVRSGSTWSQQAYLKASNTGAGDQFGFSVAISGETIVVSALTEDSNATGVNGDQTNDLALNAGAAYVFVRSGSTWSQQAYLKASNTGEGDQFGHSVDISGETVVVGAQNEDSNATGVNGNQSDDSAGDAGAAYVFVRSGSTWSQQAYLKASNTGAGDQFGASVAIAGETIVVGAIGEDSNATGVNGDQSNNSATDSGAAYVFARSGSTWSQQAYLKASNTGAGDQFGASVAIAGETIVVGALGEDSNARGVNGNQSNNSTALAGAAYVFVRSGSTWSQQAYLKASNTDLASQFGHSISISGEMIVIGAPGESSDATGINGDQSDTSAIDAGAAYVFVRSDGIWSQQLYLKASNTEERDRFGFSVAISGETILIGARDEDSNATGVNGNQGNNSALDSGAVYVFGTSCNYSIFPATRNFSAAGGIGTVSVTTDAGCTWEAVSNTPWAQITDGASGNGDGTVTFQVGANTGFARSSTIIIAGRTFTVRQGANFVDVPTNSTFYEFIGKLSAAGVTVGCGTNAQGNPIYCPGDAVTREQMAAFLVRALGEFDPPTPASQRFVDVPPSNFFYAFIDRLAALGITTGCNPPAFDQYCPGSFVTREQMAAFILRALGEFNPPTPASQRFVDVPPSNFFYAFIDRLAALGITTGCNPPVFDQYCPGSFVTREQMAAFLVRAFGL